MLHMRITMVHYGTLWRPMCVYVLLCVPMPSYVFLAVIIAQWFRFVNPNCRVLEFHSPGEFPL